MTGITRARASRLALLVATAGLALAPAPSRAADLGGDCCADLEQRVAELEATTARKGNRKVSLTISGRVNYNLMWWDDRSAALDADEPFDKHSDLAFGNTANNETRFVLNGSANVTRDLSAGFLMTIWDDPESATVQPSQITSQGPPVTAVDTTYVFVKSIKWGEYRLGYLPSASDDAYYVDFGAPGTVGGLNGTRFVGSFRLRASNLPGELTDVTYGHVLDELADSNAERLVYISPTWNGFTYKSDFGSNTSSLGLTWIGAAGTLRSAFGAGYQVSHGASGVQLGGPGFQPSASTAFVPLTDAAHDQLRQLALSASVTETHTGLFLSGEYSRAYAAIAGRQDAINWYARAGWVKDITGIGATTIDAQFERTDNKLANDTSAHLWGLGIDQAIDSVASNIYLRYQHDSFDSSGVVTAASSASVPSDCLAVCTVDAQAIDSMTAGMVVNF